MSGGFFRGTSAEQDTRFSNKQAKLLKSQKFAPELEHLVDMTKVKVDVIRPWIATRVTELLGFEDEVLINFIYGLLDGKVVNGKEVQISLTGFMEKNTGKFMKELWSLLLSAQNNASGVPQQFLDAKEEETRKKKADVDWIANEIQKKKDKESRELDQERLRNMDGDVEMKSTDAELEPSSKLLSKVSSVHPDDERDAGRRNGVRSRKRASGSPNSADRSPSSPQRSRSRSLSRSLSNSGSHAKRRARSVSRSPEPRGRSVSSDRVKRSPRRRSFTPRPRHSPHVPLSPPRRKSYRRRSRSRSPRRSRSPVRHRFRSPYQHRSPSPVRRRSISPARRRRSPSPARRRRSPSPARRRRSPSPARRRWSPSPARRRRSPSPVRRRTPPPIRRRSPSPMRRRRRRFPSTSRRRSPSPMQRRPPPSNQRSLTPLRGRSRSPHSSSSPSSARPGSPSPNRRKSSKEHRRSPLESPQSSREGDRLRERSSSMTCWPRNQKELQNKVSVLSSSPEKSPTVSESPSKTRKRAASPYNSPLRQTREWVTHQDSPETSKENEEANQAREDDNSNSRSLHRRSLHSPNVSKQKTSASKLHSSERLGGSRSIESQNHSDPIETREKHPEDKNENSFGKEVYPGTPDQRSSPITDGRGCFRENEVRDSDQFHKTETVAMPVEKVDHNNQNFDSDSEGKDKHRSKRKEKRKHRRSERQEVTSDDDYSSESEIEDRKEAKRRRKEEKRLRKEEKRRRREERHRRREERRAEKLKLKKQDDSNASEGEHVSKAEPHSSDEETVSDQKKLEIELRKKALESLKAKKGISR